MLYDFSKIKEYFDSLNEDKSHFINSNDICTPMYCVREMLESLPPDFWTKKDLKILDPCCGNGNFHAYTALKTSLKNLYFNEINEKRIVNLKKYFGTDINLSKKDFLDFEEKEVYDLVVANPPYAKFNGTKRVSKNHNLSRAFIEKALKITKKEGFLLFIVPNNWMSFADRNTLPQELSKYQFLVLDIGSAKKYFPKIGSSFTWFLLQKVPNLKETRVRNSYILKDEQEVRIKENSPFIPLYYSKLAKSILEKTIYKGYDTYKIQTSSNLHRYTKKELLSEKPSEEFKYKIIHTPSQVLYSKRAHIYQDTCKVFISLTNQYQSFIDKCGMTQSIAFIQCKDYEEAKRIKSELDNPLYVFLNNITRYGNFNNIRVLQTFPKFRDFKLSKDELSFIEKFNKAYYGKK